MNTTFQSIRVGIFFVLGLILIYAVYTVIGSGAFKGGDVYPISAEFDNIRTLTPGAEVRMAGVRIGQIASTELVAGRGRVTLSILETVSIPADSVAQITMASLLGQNYISVSYGEADQMLSAGDSILTQASPDFDEILGQIQDLGERLNAFADGLPDMSEAGIGDLFNNLNALVTDNRDRFDTVMSNMQDLTTKMNDGTGTLGKLINEDGLYEELMGAIGGFRSASDDMQAALGGARELIDKVKSGEGTLGRLLADDGIAVELEATIANMREFSEKLNSAESTLGKLVSDDSLYRQMEGMMNKADQALNSLGESGPITAVGVISGALF